eukprot:scaffold4771_cov129-Isochrysis_galbana.AAC.2
MVASADLIGLPVGAHGAGPTGRCRRGTHGFLRCEQVVGQHRQPFADDRNLIARAGPPGGPQVIRYTHSAAAAARRPSLGA